MIRHDIPSDTVLLLHHIERFWLDRLTLISSAHASVLQIPLSLHRKQDALMAVSLSKGGNVSLIKASNENPNTPKDASGAPAQLTAVTVGLGWDVRTTTGTEFDLDASAIALGTDGKLYKGDSGWFVFFNNKATADQSIVSTGDNRTGEGAGDDEQIKVNLAALPADVDKIVFPVSIYDADTRSQNFGQVRNAYIRIVNANGDVEIARYDLSEDAATGTSMVFGELYRNGDDWKFRAVGQDYASGLQGIAQDFGVAV